MKKVKFVLFNSNDIFFSIGGGLLETTYKGVNPLSEIDVKLKEFGLSKDSKMSYLGTVDGAYILSVEVDSTFSDNNLDKKDVNDLMDEYAATNLIDYSALSLFVIKNLKVKNITKENE